MKLKIAKVPRNTLNLLDIFAITPVWSIKLHNVAVLSFQTEIYNYEIRTLDLSTYFI